MDVRLSFTLTCLKVDVFDVTFNVDESVVAPDTFNTPVDCKDEKLPLFWVFVPIEPTISFEVKVPVKLILPELSIVDIFVVDELFVDNELPILISS